MAKMGAGHYRQASVQVVNTEMAPGYYGLPVIHGPHWRWSIVFYFVLGGLAGGSAVLAAVAQLVGGYWARPIVRAGRYLAVLAVLPGPLLLIIDLGRPERFHHMLRVLKLRSPMSLGVWGLIGFTATALLNALQQVAEDGLLGRRNPVAHALRCLPTRLLAATSALPAFFLAGYTGVLLGATAVPLWARNALRLGPLFLCSALSSAAAALSLLIGHRPTARRAQHALERVEQVAVLGELILLETLRRSDTVVTRPLREGREGLAYTGARVGSALALVLHSIAKLLPRSPHGWLRMLGSLAALVSAFLLRAAMIFGGRRSAEDPVATIAITRKDTGSPSTAP